MAPSKSASTQKSKSSSASTSLKQGTLGFASFKRTASSNSIGPGKKPARTKSTPTTRSTTAIDIESTSEDIDSADDVKLSSSEEEIEDIVEERRALPATKASTTSKKVADKKNAGGKSAEKKSNDSTGSKVGVFNSRAGLENSKSVAAESTNAAGKPELNHNDVRWRKHYGEVRGKMGNLQPVHSEKQTKIHHILRVFDLSYEFGPCVGVSRLERWQRASALGLNPPNEVYEILSTKSGMEPEFAQSVFYEEV